MGCQLQEKYLQNHLALGEEYYGYKERRWYPVVRPPASYPKLKFNFKLIKIEITQATDVNLKSLKFNFRPKKLDVPLDKTQNLKPLKFKYTVKKQEAVVENGARPRPSKFKLKLKPVDVSTETNVDLKTFKFNYKLTKSTIVQNTNIELKVLKFNAKSTSMYSVSITNPSNTKYITTDKTNVIFGTSGKFKLNPTGYTVGGSLLHLTVAKPVVATVQATFSLVTNQGRVEAGAFKYVSDDGTLTITNLNDITTALVEDTDASNQFEIPTTLNTLDGTQSVPLAITNVTAPPEAI